MNLGNPIQLLLFMAFVGAGSWLGQELIGGWTGAALGGVIGVFARMALGLLAGDWPTCSCGNNEVSGFDLVELTPGQRVWKCQQCGKSYELKRREWREILDDGTPVPRLRQNRLGKWKQ